MSYAFISSTTGGVSCGGFAVRRIKVNVHRLHVRVQDTAQNNRIGKYTAQHITVIQIGPVVLLAALKMSGRTAPIIGMAMIKPRMPEPTKMTSVSRRIGPTLAHHLPAPAETIADAQVFEHNGDVRLFDHNGEGPKHRDQDANERQYADEADPCRECPKRASGAKASTAIKPISRASPKTRQK